MAIEYFAGNRITGLSGDTKPTGVGGPTTGATFLETNTGRVFYYNGTSWTEVDYNNYTHPTYSGDDFSVDTGPLTGATVVSDIDINVTTDTLGHVTDANGTVATRTLTLANLGYTGATDADNYGDWNLLVDGSAEANITSAANVNFVGGTNVTLTYSGTNNTITIDATDTNTQLSEEQVQDFAWNVLGGTQTLITVTYDDANNEVDFVVQDDLSLYDNTTTGFTDNVGTVTSVSVTAGDLIDVTGTTITSSGNFTLNVDLSELTDMTATMVGTDEFVVLDAVSQRRKAANEIGLSIFDNDSGFTTNVGTVTSIGITPGNLIDVTGSPVTSSGNITIDVDLAELPDGTTAVVGTEDEIVYLDNGVQRRKLVDEWNLGQFNNDQGWTDNTGTVTSVSGTGTVNGISLSGTVTSSGNITLGGTLSINNNDWSGADLSLANGGTGASLVDPNGDRIMFWDDSAGTVDWLDLGTNLSIAGTTLNATDTNTTYTAGTGLALSGTEFNFDFSELTDLTSNIAGTDEFIIQSSGVESRKAASEIDISVFNNDSGYTTNAGTVTSVTSGNGMSFTTITGSGSVTLGTPSSITSSSTNSTTATSHTHSLSNDAVTNAKLRNSTALSVIGRGANTTGDPADIAASVDGQVLRRSGTSLGFGTIATAGIANNAVTFTKLEDIAEDTIVGRISTGTGDAEELTASQVRTIINVADGATANTGTVTSVGTGTGLSGGAITTSGTIDLDFDNLSEKTGDLVGTDRLTGVSGTTHFSETISNIPVSIFDNDSGWTSNTGTVTSVAISSSDGIDIVSGSPITGSGTIDLGLDSTVVRTSGAQTIGGAKTFTDDITIDVGTAPQIVLDESALSLSLTYTSGEGIYAVSSSTADHVFKAGATELLRLDSSASQFDLNSNALINIGDGTINSQTNLGATPAAGDEFLIYDASAAADSRIKKVAYSDLGILLSNNSETITGPWTFDNTLTVTNDNLFVLNNGVSSVTLTCDSSGVLDISGNLALVDDGLAGSLDALSDPGANRVVVWDDTANAIAWGIPSGSVLLSSNVLALDGDNASPGANQYYGTNGVSTKGFHALPSAGIANVVEDTTPQFGGTVDANGFDIDMGANHLICDQRIAEHDGDTNTYMEFNDLDRWQLTLGGNVIMDVYQFQVRLNGDLQTLDSHMLCNQRIVEHNGDSDTYLEFAGANSFRIIVGGVAAATFNSTAMTVATDISMSGNNLICGEKIAEHFGDTNTHIDFPGLDQWSVTVGGTSMLEVGTSGVDVDGYVRNRANVIAVTTSGTTAIGTTTTGNTYYDTHSTGTHFYRLDSATVGTQIEVHRNGAGTVTFSQGTSQTIIQGTSVNLKDKSAMVAKCVATNTWSVVGGAA